MTQNDQFVFSSPPNGPPWNPAQAPTLTTPIRLQRADIWPSVPKEVRHGISVACIAFPGMNDEQKLATLLLSWQRSTVLAIDRAKQVADLSVVSHGATMAA